MKTESDAKEIESVDASTDPVAIDEKTKIVSPSITCLDSTPTTEYEKAYFNIKGKVFDLIRKGNEWEDIKKIIFMDSKLSKPPLEKEHFEEIITDTYPFYEDYIKTASEKPEEITEDDLEVIKADINNRRIPDLNDYLPKDHFINQFCYYVSLSSDTYYEFSVTSAIWFLSALLKDRGVIKFKQKTLHGNLYTYILGQSTKSRKSTAKDKAVEIYEEVVKESLYNDEPTCEAYFEMLAKNPIQNFVKDEAGSLLAKFNKKCNCSEYS